MDVHLSGHYNLGTRENPTIWYVSGNIKTKRPTTFSGYGVFIVKGNVEFYHDVSGDSEETMLGFYTPGSILLKESGISLRAQLFANGGVEFESDVTLYGNITTSGKVEFKGAASLYYRPASPALTEPFWPMSQ